MLVNVTGRQLSPLPSVRAQRSAAVLVDFYTTSDLESGSLEPNIQPPGSCEQRERLQGLRLRMTA